MELNLSNAIWRFYPGETQHDRPSFAVNESVPKSRPCWATHTLLGNLGKYSLPPGMTHLRGSGYCPKLHLQKLWQRYLGQVPQGKILATPLLCSRSWAKISLNWSPKVRSGTKLHMKLYPLLFVGSIQMKCRKRIRMQWVVVNSKLAQCPLLEKQDKNPRTVVNFRAYIVSESVGQDIFVYSRLSPFPRLLVTLSILPQPPCSYLVRIFTAHNIRMRVYHRG